MALQYKIIHPVKYYRDCLSHDVRPDGRELFAFRPLAINVDSISTADGSAIVKVGNTTVVCGIKAELAQPKSTEPESGFLVPNIELSPLCSPKYRPGAPTEEAQVYSQMLSDIITNSQCVDLKKLCIVKEKLVWVLYCDIVCIDHDGCVVDASVIAALAALKTLTLPTVIYNSDTSTYKVNDSERNKIDIKSLPVSSSFIVFDDNVIIVDPTNKEEELSSTQVTIALCNTELCYIYKPGGTPLKPEQLEICMKFASSHETTVITLLKTVLND